MTSRFEKDFKIERIVMQRDGGWLSYESEAFPGSYEYKWPLHPPTLAL